MQPTQLGEIQPDLTGLSFLHAADLHLGASRHVLDAFDRLVQTALDRRVAFVALAGDVYDSADREARLQKRFFDGLGRLARHGIHTFVAHGNHDPVEADFRPVVGALPPEVHVFTPGEPQTFEMSVAGRRVAVTGVSFGTQKEQTNLVAQIAGTQADADVRVAVVHANVMGVAGHDPYAPCYESDFAASDIDYWALGHIHQQTVRRIDPGPDDAPGRWWVYPGNLQGRSTKPAECGEKGVLVVSADGTRFHRPEFVPCDVYRFLRIRATVDGIDEYDPAVERVVEDVRAKVASVPSAGATVRIEVVGRTAAHDQLLKLLEEDVSRLLDDPRITVDRIEPLTQRQFDRARLAEGDDLVAALLGRIDGLRESGRPIAAGTVGNDAPAVDRADELPPDPLVQLVQSTAGETGTSLQRIADLLAVGALDRADLLDRIETTILDRLVVDQ